MGSIEEQLRSAKQHHQAGRRKEAEQLCAEILRASPNHADAMNLSGVLKCEAGQLDQAADFLARAIAIDSTQAIYFSNLGVVLMALDRKPQAIEAYRKALKLRPDFPEVCGNLGAALESVGQLDEAIEILKRAIVLRPNYADGHNNLGIALQNQGKLDEAIAAFRQAIVFQPRHAKAFHNLSNALREQGMLEESLTAARQAVALDPLYPESFNALGTTLQVMGRLDGAILIFHQALTLRPNYPDALYNLGNALNASDRQDLAINAYARAISFRPDFFEAQNNLGVALNEVGRKEEAADVLRRALQLQPNSAEAHNSLGGILQDLGQLDEALASYEKAIALRPDFSAVQSNRLYVLHFNPKYDPAAILAAHQRWNAEQAEPLKREIVPHNNKRDKTRKLRIGYVSPDFRSHCQAMFTIPLLSNHDRSKFEIYCYASVFKPDEITRRIQKFADHWRNVLQLNDAQLAQKIRSDEIDILVDLTMHMSDGRPLLFARKPAPVQVAWLAYPGTTGLTTMDYRLTDPFLDPEISCVENYTEQSIRLPNTFWCYDPLTSEPAVNSLPALTNGYITFGCLNNFCKVNDSTLALWAKVLAAIPMSRLILMSPPGKHRQGILDKLGIEPKRLEFAVFQPRHQYLKTYHRIDLGLDTIPYNGHTTSLDSLWMGVPVVSLIGRTVVSRAGFSQTSNLELAGELVATNEDDFVAIAKTLCGNLDRLSQLRSTLRQRMEQSPLMDGKRFAQNMESAFRGMWVKWCHTAS